MIEIIGVICLISGIGIALYFSQKYIAVLREIQDLKIHHSEEIENIKNQTLPQKVLSSIIARLPPMLEKFLPHSKLFPYNPEDVIYLGGQNPVDYIVFDGLKNNTLKQIVFVDAKSGTGRLTKSQKEIERVIKNKNVDFITINITEKEELITKEKIKDSLITNQ